MNSLVIDDWLLVQIIDEQHIGLVHGEPYGTGHFVFDPAQALILNIESTLGLLPLEDHKDKVQQIIQGIL